MQSTPPVRRRTQAQRTVGQMRVTPPPQDIQPKPQPELQPKKKKSRKGIITALAAFIAILAVIVLVSPKEPLTRAAYTSADAAESVLASGRTDAYEGLVISEIMASNDASVPDDKGEYVDWVEIWNSSDAPINLENIGLSDRSDSIRFLFPDVVIQPDERVVVFCNNTNQSEIGKDYHAKFKISSVGETIYLFDPSAYLIDSVKTPVLNSDETYAMQEDGTFAVSARYTPGYPNSEEGYQAYLASTMVAAGELIINEVMADPLSGLADADGEFVDWVELHNTTDRTIYLKNYALSDKENKPLKWRFPDNAVVEPGGYYIVFCSGKDRVDAGTNIAHTNFSISAEHDTIVLSDSHGRLVDRVTVDNLPEDCSYGRDASGMFTVFTLATPSLPNTQAGAAQMDYQLRQMNASGVIISEVMLSNESVNAAVEGYYEDWIELYNTTNEMVDLSGYGLSDNIGRARKWQFPQGTYIYPGEYKIIYCDGLNGLKEDGLLHTSYSLSREGGETVCLSDPTGRVLDKLVLPEVPTNISYGRTLGRSGFFYYDAPTPLMANGDGFGGYAQAPVLTVTPGLYYETVHAGITVPEGTTVYYTTDGSVPTQASTPYTGGTIEINFTTVIRARAFGAAELKPSETVTGTYFVNIYHTLPVVSVVVDPYDLWNEENGMLAPGPNIDKSVFPFENALYREVKESGELKEGYVEYYLLDGTQVLSQGMGISLHGQYSLDMPQKTFKLRAKSLYGESTFAAKLFDDRPYTEYKSFLLRNSGNDNVWTRLADGFQSRLLDAYGSTVIHQAWNPVVVYLNGEYWGHYNMRERIDRFFVAQHEGLPLDNTGKITILKGGSPEAQQGSNKEWRAMIKKIKQMSPATNEEDLQYILDNVDVDNYFEYLALEMFFGNTDIGNIRFYKLEGEDSKWKWIFFDADYGMFSSDKDTPKSFTREGGMGEHYIDNTIFVKLLEHPDYKDKFLRQLADIYKTFTTEYMLEVLEPLVAQIQPEMKLHWARWGELNEPNIIAEAPRSADGAYRYWEKRVERLRNVCRKRPTLLYGYIQDAFKLTDEQMLDYFGECPEMPEGVV